MDGCRMMLVVQRKHDRYQGGLSSGRVLVGDSIVDLEPVADLREPVVPITDLDLGVLVRSILHPTS